MLLKAKLSGLVSKCLPRITISVHTRKTWSSLAPFVPFTLDLRDQTVSIEESSEGDITSISQLLIQASESGEGYDENQFKSEADVKLYLSRAHRCLKVSSTGGAILGLYGITDSLIARSQKGYYGSNFIYLDRSIRGQGVAGKLLRQALPATIPGRSYLTRTVVTERSIVSLLRAGWSCVGTIPNSVYMANIGWADDLLVCSSDDFDEGKKAQFAEKDRKVPQLEKTVATETNLNLPFPGDISLPDLTLHGTTFSVLQATTDDLWVVEDMVRTAALQGQGFALDGFTQEGHFNRSLLKDNHLLVVKDSGGHLVAAIVFGGSGVCRGRNPGQVAGCMVVAEDMRGRGLGGALLGYSMQNAHLLGYTAILTDVFCTDSVPLGMLLRRGFLVTATLPNCGVVAGRGRTHSLLCYKPLVT